MSEVDDENGYEDAIEVEYFSSDSESPENTRGPSGPGVVNRIFVSCNIEEVRVIVKEVKCVAELLVFTLAMTCHE